MAQKAPGKHYRKGITLIELFQMFPDEQSARTWFEEIRWPNQERYCPHCGSIKVSPVPNEKPLPYWCSDCREYFSVKTGTIMHRSKLPLQKWVIAIYLMSTSLKGVSSMKLHRDLGVTQKTAWMMAQKIREGWIDGDGELMIGPVEVDETYMGGLERNKPKSKRANQGRGPVNKTGIIGVKERDTGRVKADVLEDGKGETLKKFVRENVIPGATLFTDENRGYVHLGENYGGVYNHKRVKHSAKEYVNGMAHTNGIESFWALLKRGYHGTYHKMSKKHLARYVAEFSGRHNLRPLDTISQMELLAKGFNGKRLSWKTLTE